jgi:septum formation inhibitor MinC
MMAMSRFKEKQMKKTKATQIREMLKEGKSVEEIVKAVNTSTQYVHTLSYLERKKEGKAKKAAPRKKVVKEKPVESGVPSVYAKHVDAIVKKNIELLKEVHDLCAVVDYLEFRLDKEIRRGASV